MMAQKAQDFCNVLNMDMPGEEYKLPPRPEFRELTAGEVETVKQRFPVEWAEHMEFRKKELDGKKDQGIVSQGDEKGKPIPIRCGLYLDEPDVLLMWTREGNVWTGEVERLARLL